MPELFTGGKIAQISLIAQYRGGVQIFRFDPQI